MTQVGRLLARCGLAEVVERMRMYQQAALDRQAAAAERLQSNGVGGAPTAGVMEAAAVAGGGGGSGEGDEGEQLPASDPALSLAHVSEAMRNFFVLVSSPDALPEFRAIMVSG